MKKDKEREGLSKTIACAASKTEWTTAIEYEVTHASSVLKNVAVWFSPGCLGKVGIRFTHKGFPIAPFAHSKFGDAGGFVGDDIRYPCYVNKQLEPTDIINVEYKNSDDSIHSVVVQMEIEKEISEPEEDEEEMVEIKVEKFAKIDNTSVISTVKKLIMDPRLTEPIEIMEDD